jgi:hypothetical protein
VVASVDAEAHRSLGSRFGITGFPIIKFFPKGATEPIPYAKKKKSPLISPDLETSPAYPPARSHSHWHFRPLLVAHSALPPSPLLLSLSPATPPAATSTPSSSSLPSRPAPAPRRPAPRSTS